MENEPQRRKSESSALSKADANNRPAAKTALSKKPRTSNTNRQKPDEAEASVATTEDYVGYGHPPKRSQYQKGVSGWPGGKPRVKLPGPEAIILELLQEQLTTAKGRMTAGEYLCRQLVDLTAKGNKEARRLLFEMWSKAAGAGGPAHSPEDDFAALVRMMPGNPAVQKLTKSASGLTKTNNASKKPRRRR